MWARVVAGAVVSAALSEPSGSGWQEVADTPKPPDTPTTTWERGVEVSSGVPVVSWSPRDKTEAATGGVSGTTGAPFPLTGLSWTI